MKKYIIITLFSLVTNLVAQVEEESEALRAMRLSCEKHKVGLGCFNYANMLLRKNSTAADHYFEMGCKLEHEPSCKQERWDLLTTPKTAVESPQEDAPIGPEAGLDLDLGAVEESPDSIE